MSLFSVCPICQAALDHGERCDCHKEEKIDEGGTTMIVKCKFLDEDNKPKGREYTYGSHEEVVEGELVTTEEGKRLVVTATDIPQEEEEKFGDNLKFVHSVVDIPPENVVITQDVEAQELIVIKQLPVIEERLKSLSDEIDTKVSHALALPCTEGNVASVKTARADLNKTLEALESQRMAVKNAIMAPYEQFNSVYKTYVSDKIKSADVTLKGRILEVESDLKSRKEAEVKGYFNEYLCSVGVDFVAFSDAKINVTLSASLKSLKEQAKSFIDRIADDLNLIDTQEYKEEILVEYKGSLNCAQAITTVVTRHKAIAEQKARQAELEAKKQAQAEALKKVEAVATVTLGPPKEVNAPKGADTPQPVADSVKTLTFKVTAPISKLRELKKFLEDGGYIYE